MKLGKKGIMIVVLFLTIGFAAITTTLTIVGTITIKPNNENFENNVIFTEASSATNATAPVIGDNGKSFSFTTKEFVTIGDSETVNFTIANNSNYKAVLGNNPVSCVGTGTNADLFEEYIAITTNAGLKGATIERNGTIEGTLTATMKKSFVGEAQTVTYTCTMSIEAAEATN